MAVLKKYKKRRTTSIAVSEPKNSEIEANGLINLVESKVNKVKSHKIIVSENKETVTVFMIEIGGFRTITGSKNSVNEVINEAIRALKAIKSTNKRIEIGETQVSELKKSKGVTVVESGVTININPELDKFNDIMLSPDKFAKAEDTLSKINWTEFLNLVDKDVKERNSRLQHK